ncbi:MAG: hypothetical protein PHX83_12040 [Acidobacteriia bacterium]|nr:hypothetical protein [Terriglobia bacterium]
MSGLKPIDIIKSAYEKKTISVQFQIPLPGDTGHVDAVLTAPDVYSILEVQEEVYQGRYAELRAKGFADMAVNEDDWRAEVKTFKGEARKRIEEEKPRNLAEQMAKKFSKVRTIQELIPMFLKDRGGNKLFPTSDDRVAFKDILCSNADLMNLLAQKYLELTGKINEVAREAKNSTMKVLQSGESESTSPDATDTNLSPTN